MPASLGDVWRLYVKPSMKGAIIIRKKTVNRKSAKVIERNKIFKEKKIAKVAKEECMKNTMCVYTDKNGVRRCKWECFIRHLREVARRELSKTATTATEYVTW